MADGEPRQLKRQVEPRAGILTLCARDNLALSGWARIIPQTPIYRTRRLPLVQRVDDPEAGVKNATLLFASVEQGDEAASWSRARRKG
jgi:hypothetical protein